MQETISRFFYIAVLVVATYLNTRTYIRIRASKTQFAVNKGDVSRRISLRMTSSVEYISVVPSVECNLKTVEVDLVTLGSQYWLRLIEDSFYDTQ